MGVAGDRTNWLKLPDPTIIKQDAPVKGLLMWDNMILTGNDKGEIKLYSENFVELLTFTALKAPILKFSRQMHALIVQYKD